MRWFIKQKRPSAFKKEFKESKRLWKTSFETLQKKFAAVKE
jgi:hypothetical protein